MVATRVSSVCLTMKPCILKYTSRQQLPHAQGFLGVTPRAPRGECPRGGEEASPRRRMEREEEEEELEQKGLDGWGGRATTIEKPPSNYNPPCLAGQRLLLMLGQGMQGAHVGEAAP